MIAQILLGLALGLSIVELSFRARDDGAFPHLNVYAPDAKLGARLRPGASQRFKLGDNPTSDVRINSLGLRGAELPPPGKDEILVIGDSQAFGLGVQEQEAFAARLAALTKRQVVNAGVPTYGPLEYNAFARELIERRKPALIIYTVNMLNDLFEHARPNNERHRVWDGWAVRAETAPQDVLELPGRELLYRDSHAFYALRRYLHARSAQPESLATSLPSEGVAADLLAASASSATAPTAASQLLVSSTSERSAQLAAQAQAQKAREQAIAKAQEDERRAQQEIELGGLQGPEWQASYRARLVADMAAAHPGDIVYQPGGESSRPVTATARLIREAALARKRALADVERARLAERAQLEASSKELADARSRARMLSAAQLDHAAPVSVLEPRLREIRELAADHGAEVLVVALPIDVQVSEQEWKKYGAAPIDMTPTLALTEDVLATARGLGMRALDALPALREAEPGAFLHGDIHMTAKGHQAVAKAIASALTEPAPSARPPAGLPAGRTYPFATYDDWRATRQLVIEGEVAADCRVSSDAEWIGVRCSVLNESQKHYLYARVLEGGHGESMLARTGGEIQLRAPVLPGESLRVRIERNELAYELALQRAQDGAITGRFGAPVANPTPSAKPIAAEVASNCVCKADEWCWDFEPARLDCNQDDCDQLYPCATGERAHWPACPKGQINGDPAGQCLPMCSAARPCRTGRCEAYQGEHVCKPVAP